MLMWIDPVTHFGRLGSSVNFAALIVLAGALAPWPTFAQSADTEQAFRLTLDGRYRLEQVDQGNLEDATASTLRARLGAHWDRGDFDSLLELESVVVLGSEDYNSGSNGRTQFAPVLDPDGSEVNQAYVGYQLGGTYLRVGRQRLVLDNARFFGDVDFRQNQQTYDALMLMHTPAAGSRLLYAFMNRARRFLSDDHPFGWIDMATHTLNYSYERLNGDRLVLYAYLVEMKTPGLTQNSHKSFGASYSGGIDVGRSRMLYRLEYADQSDYADGLASNDADYLALELGLRLPNEWVASIGYEQLGGDGVYGFQTPLATGHVFNGYADLFAARTPPTGLRDVVVKLRIPVQGSSVEFGYHDFSADSGGLDYGTEVDVAVDFRFAQNYYVGFKFADYRADGFGVDTTKWWLSAGVLF